MSLSRANWEIKTYRQVDGKFVAIAERTEPGKRFVVNAEGRTPSEAVECLQANLTNQESKV